MLGKHLASNFHPQPIQSSSKVGTAKMTYIGSIYNYLMSYKYIMKFLASIFSKTKYFLSLWDVSCLSILSHLIYVCNLS